MVLFSFTNVNVNGGILGWKAKGMDERERERCPLCTTSHHPRARAKPLVALGM